MTTRRLIVGLLVIGGCDDALDQRLAVVDQPRLLAVVSEPAEVTPGETVAVRALIADAGGTVDESPAWALCLAPKPPTEDNVVAQGCLETDVTDLGSGAMVSADVPADACLRFGPDTTMPGFRPRDPDATGGYYQPVRATVADLELVGFGLTRIKCKLPNAPAQISTDYSTRYQPNANPPMVELAIDGDPVDSVPAQTEVTLTASWPAEAAETFLYYDPLSQTLVERRESLRVSWFTTGGTIEVDGSAVTEDDDATSVSTIWQTPGAGPATLWLVLRDSRGGIATGTVDLQVR